MQIQPLMGPGVASYEQPTEAATEMDLEAKYQQHLQLLDEQEKYAPIQSTGVVSSFTGGVGAGIDQTQALLGGAVGLAGSAAKNLTGGMIGSDMEAWGQETYRENMKQAQRYVPVEGAATFAEADSVSDYANWAAHTAGELLPTMATMLAGGGVGGAIGKQLLGNTLKVTAAKSVAETLGKKGLLSATEKGVLADAVKIAGRPERWGQTLGVGLGSTALESGGIYGRQVTGENFDEQNDPEVGNALLYGGIAGALDSIVPAYLLNKLGTGKALSAALTKGDAAKQSLLAGALKEITKTAPIEGVTEVLQGVLERAAQQDSEGRLDTPEGLEKVFDSKQAIEEFAAGMLGGTLFGGPAGAMAANQQNKQQALLGERESKVAALRERIRVEAERARQAEELKARQAPWVALAEQARQQTTQDQAVGRLRQIKMKLAELQGTSPDTVDIYRKDAKGGKQAQALMAEAQTISQTLMGEAKGPSAEQRQETIQTTPLARQQEIDSLFPMQPDEKQRLMQSRAEQGIQARELPVEEVSAEPPYMVEDLGTPEEITAPPLTGQERIDETAREVQKGIQLTLMDKARQQAQEAEKETQLGLMETENEAQLRRIEQENEAQRKELEQEIPPRVTPESLPANNLLATPEMAKLRRKLEFEQRPSVEEDASAGEQMASTPPSPARTRLAEELGERHVRRAEESGFLKVIPDEEWEQQGFNPSAHGMFVSKGNNGQARIYVKASAADPVSVVLHESEHADMKTVLGESYGGIQRQFDRALKAGDERALSAQQRVNASLKIWREGQVRRGKTPSAAQEQAIIQSERLAYFIEEAQVREGERPTGLLGRMLNSVRAWWRTSELGKSWAANGMGNLSDGVTLALAKRAFKVGALKAEMLEGAGAEKAGEQSEQPSFAGKSAIPAKTQDVDNEKQIVTFGDTQQNGEMASIENSPRAIAQAAKPEFKEWFGDSAVVTAEGKPKMVFRGDRNFEGTSLKMPTDGLINQQLGVHFAADPRQTDAFTIGTYARDSTWTSDDNTVPGEQRMWDGTSYPIRAKPGGSTMAGWIASDKIYTIPNYGMSDQANISTEAVGWLLRKEPEVFVQYVMQTRNVTEEQARAAWDTLSKGNPIETGALKVPVTYIEETGGDGFKAFASNYISDGAFPNIKGTPWATYVANTFRQHLLDSGYKVIQYENTSGNEVGPGIDPTAYIVLDPLAFKAYTNKGTFGKDTDNVLASVPKTPGFETWRQKAPVIRADNTQAYAGGGSPAVFEMFHGTTHGEIRKFKMEGGNTINSLGQGSYFTTSREDASSNYAGEGPDLSNRIDREMDQIRDSFWEDPDMATWVLEDYFQAHQIEEDVTDDNLDDLGQQYGDKAIREVAVKAVKGETDGLIMPVWVKLLKPFDMGPNGLELEYKYNPETDQEEGNAIDLLKALREVGYEWGEDVSSLEQYLMEDGMDKITAEDFWKEGKRELAIYSDPDGNEASYGQFLQEVVRRAGFDGIIQDADAEYGTGRLYGSPMKGVTPGTLHIIPFSQNQIKSSLGNSGNYSLQDDDITASVPKQQTYTPEFKNWFGDWEADPKNASKIVDEAGRPLVVYHGTKRNFNEFIAAYPDGLVFFTTNNKFAEKWPVGNGGLRTGPEGTEEEGNRIRARENQLYKEIMQPDYDFGTKEGQAAYDADRAKLKERITQETGFPSSWSFESEAGIQVIPVYLDIKKPFDPSKQWAEMEPFLRDRLGDEIINKDYHKKGNWLVYEDKAVIDELKRRGYDGIWLNEQTNGPQETIATFYPERQIKSAIGNSGRFDLADSDFAASVFSGAAVGPLSAEIQNRKSLWRRSVDYIKRGWAPAGHLSTYAPGAHAEIISRDSAQNMEDAMGERFVHDLERAIEEDTGQSHTKLADADWDNINEALRGDAAAFNALSANVQPVVGGMRIYLDSFSKQYAGVLQTIVDEMGGGVTQLTQEVAALRARIKGMPKGQDRTDLMAEARAKQSELNQLTARMGGKQQLITIIQGNLGKWLNRSYRVFDDKNWYKNVEEGVLERAQQYIVNSQGVTPEAANTQIRRLLKDMTAFDSMEDWIREGKVGALDLRTLLQRKDIAQPILDLLGEYRDPRVNFAKSAAKVTRLVFNTQLQLRLRDIGLQTGWFSNDPKAALPPGMDKTITGGKNYEYLDGLITYHEVAQGLHDILGHQPWPPWLENIVQVTSFVKRQKTLMSPLPTTFRNYITSLMGMVANGDYSWKGIKYGADAAREYIFNKDLGNKRQHLDHITILGVSYDTPFTGELDALLKDTKLEDSLLKEGAPGQKNSIGLTIYRGWEKFNKVMTRGYQFGDDFVKIAAFHGKYANLNRLIGERVRAEYQGQSADSTWQNPTIGSISLRQGEDGSWSFRDQYGHNIVEEQTSWGTEQEARQEVGEVLGKWHVEKMTAERIRNTYMTYSMVGRVPRFLRKFPLTGTFVSFPVEVLRTVSNMARYIGRDMKDPELRPMAIRQSLGMLVAATAAYGAEEWARRAIGLTKEELKAQKEGLAPWDTFSTMVPIGRDEKNRPQFFNTGYVDLYSMLHILPNALNSNMPKGEALEKAAWQLAAPFIGWDITAGKVKEVLLNKTESGRMIWDPVRDSPTDQGLKITEHLLRGVASTTLLKGEKIFQAMAGVRTPDGERLDTQEEILGLFGAKPVTLDPARIINYGLMEFQGQKRAVTSALSRAIADTRDTDLGMEYLRAKSARDKAYATMGRKVAAAKAMGWSGEQVFTMLRRLKVDRKDANALVRGEVPRWRVTSEAFKSAVQRAKSLGDGERVQEVKERRRELLDRLLEG